MNRLEMAKKLFENPKLNAKNNFKESLVSARVYQQSGCIDIVYDNTLEVLELYYDPDETWEIIEPKLKEFTFGEMYYIYGNQNINCRKIKSCISGLTYERSLSTIPLEEMKGNWTIEGYYEGDDNE